MNPMRCLAGLIAFRGAAFARFETAFFLLVDFFAAAFFLAAFLLLVFRRLAMKRLSAAWTVDLAWFVERVCKVASAATLRLERLVATNDAIAIVSLVGAKAAADRAVFGDQFGHAGI